MAGCAGAVVGTEVCGTPEPGFGVAGLFCAQAQRPNIKTREKKSDALGERCIVFRELPTIGWMQRAATQMAGNLKSALPNLREGFAIQQMKQSYCPAALGVKVNANPGQGLEARI